jgi:hypothetical protein
MTDREVEEPLSGGFSNVVVRKGHTVRRNCGPWTPAVHALLVHLHSVGFGYAPRALGIDDQGREILTFIDGKTAWWPWPEVLLTDAGLRVVARMVTRLAAAVENFVDPPDAVWHGGPRADPSFRIRHGDLAPWNTVWNETELVGLIDWDTAEPAPPLWTPRRERGTSSRFGLRWATRTTGRCPKRSGFTGLRCGVTKLGSRLTTSWQRCGTSSVSNATGSPNAELLASSRTQPSWPAATWKQLMPTGLGYATMTLGSGCATEQGWADDLCSVN